MLLMLQARSISLEELTRILETELRYGRNNLVRWR